MPNELSPGRVTARDGGGYSIAGGDLRELRARPAHPLGPQAPWLTGLSAVVRRQRCPSFQGLEPRHEPVHIGPDCRTIEIVALPDRLEVRVAGQGGVTP